MLICSIYRIETMNSLLFSGDHRELEDYCANTNAWLPYTKVRQQGSRPLRLGEIAAAVGKPGGLESMVAQLE